MTQSMLLRCLEVLGTLAFRMLLSPCWLELCEQNTIRCGQNWGISLWCELCVTEVSRETILVSVCTDYPQITPICVMRESVPLSGLWQFVSRRSSSAKASIGSFTATVYWPVDFYNKV